MFGNSSKIKELEDNLEQALRIKERYKKHADSMRQLLTDPEYLAFWEDKKLKLRKEAYGYLADNRDNFKIETDGNLETRSYKDLELTRLSPSMFKEPTYQAIYKKHKLDFAKELWEFSDHLYMFFNKPSIKKF